MTLATRFRINTPGVVHETFDDEVVIIDFDSGSYYSLNESGTAVWSLLQGGATVSGIVAEMGRRYEGEQAQIEEAVRQLVDELRQENLIVSDGAGEPEVSGESVDPGQEAHGPMLETPTLQKYTDMQELLLLDPIHDVDETGWPNLPEA
jgi:hypothetical protein